MYPAHLPIKYQHEHVFGGGGGGLNSLMCVCVIRFREFIKRTHKCCYIPRSSNHPRSIKLGWIKGEVVQFLRICSHKVFLTYVWPTCVVL